MGMFDDIGQMFQELEDGRYIVRIENYYRKKTNHNLNPLCWELKLMNESSLVLPMKFSQIETNYGFQILMRELKNLGCLKPTSAAEFEEVLTSLKGAIIEVNITTTKQNEGLRDIRFLRKLY